MARLRITVTDMDSIILDEFAVLHWKDEGAGLDGETMYDAEAYGSPASESLLVQRIVREAEALDAREDSDHA